MSLYGTPSVWTRELPARASRRARRLEAQTAGWEVEYWSLFFHLGRYARFTRIARANGEACRMPDSADIRNTLLSKGNLPVMPEALARIWQMADDPKVGARELADVIKLDPGLALEILKLVNSAQFALKKTIGSLWEAIALLGTRAVKNLTITLLVKNGLLPRRREPIKFNRPSFWRHSVGTGFGAEALASSVSGVSPESAYVAGLLHDVGIMALDKVVPAELARLIDRIESNEAILVSEREVLGCTHCEIGKLVAEAWGFPPEVVQPIAYHHDPLKARTDDNKRISCIVAVADFMMSSPGRECYGTEFTCLERSWLTCMKVDADAVTNALDDASGRLEQAAELLALAD
jgi:putative nucleotidyltransferase with HDIG domain